MSAALISSERVEAELLDADESAIPVSDWEALAARAIEPNVFLSPWMARARLRHLPDNAGARVAAAWRHAGGDRRLVGLMLLVRPRGRHYSPFPILRSAELYAPLSTPLLDPENPAESWSALLSALRRAGIVAAAMPFMSAGGPAFEALLFAQHRDGLPLASLESHHRAFLRSTLSGDDYIRTNIERRRRKEAGRQRRRLSDLGELRFSVARNEIDVAGALELFLELEAAGWKGRAGTDITSAPGAAPYFRQIARDGSQRDAFRVALLTLDGKPIAAGLVAIAGRRAFYVKTAYDEELARFSPGLLVTLDMTAHLLGDPSIEEADSVALADHPMIDRIWAQRLAISSILVGTRPGRDLSFNSALMIERARASGRDAVKSALAAFRTR